MPRRVTRLVPGELMPMIGRGPDGEPLMMMLEVDEVEEWAPESPERRWTEWRIVDTHEDEDPTYYPSYDPRLHPVHRTRTTWERQLLECWVDREQGSMARLVETERRTTG